MRRLEILHGKTLHFFIRNSATFSFANIAEYLINESLHWHISCISDPIRIAMDSIRELRFLSANKSIIGFAVYLNLWLGNCFLKFLPDTWGERCCWCKRSASAMSSDEVVFWVESHWYMHRNWEKVVDLLILDKLADTPPKSYSIPP